MPFRQHEILVHPVDADQSSEDTDRPDTAQQEHAMEPLIVATLLAVPGVIIVPGDPEFAYDLENEPPVVIEVLDKRPTIEQGWTIARNTTCLALGTDIKAVTSGCSESDRPYR